MARLLLLKSLIHRYNGKWINMSQIVGLVNIIIIDYMIKMLMNIFGTVI